MDGTLDTIAAGETKTVKVALDEQPPTGQNVPIVGSPRCRAKRRPTTTSRPTRRSSRGSRGAPRYPAPPVDELTSTQGIVALAAAGAALLALIWAVVLSIKLRRLRPSSR